jgi:predicted dehydrogenase
MSPNVEALGWGLGALHFLLEFGPGLWRHKSMKPFSPQSGITRRRFLATTSIALAAPTIIPASALGREGNKAPSERITLASVGWGMQGPGNTDAFMKEKDCVVLAVCDVDSKLLEDAVNKVNGRYGNQDCKSYKDYRALMARKDIDAVMIAVPDSWHALISIEAANNKKDIYGEKPLARTIAEQQAIVKAVKKNKCIWQTGSWQRSQGRFRNAAEIVRNGFLGKLTHVEVGLPSGHHDFARTAPALRTKLETLPDKPQDLSKIVPGTPAWDLAVTAAPAHLDYEAWIGPSQMEPYIEARVHKNWRWNYNVGGGQLLDWIGHHCDIAHWGMDCDDKGGPSEIEGTGEFPPSKAIWNTCTKYRITCKYPKDVIMTIAGGHPDIKGGTKWIGTEGWVWVDRGQFDASNLEWFQQIQEDKHKVKLYRSDNHMRNFLDCVKSRKPTITPAETAHHSAIPGHLGLIAMMTGRKLKWDPSKETILGDKDATKLLSRTYRSSWKLA